MNRTRNDITGLTATADAAARAASWFTFHAVSKPMVNTGIYHRPPEDST